MRALFPEVDVTGPDEPWFVTAFGADYLEVYPHRDLESAAQEVDGLLRLAPLAGRVLDLCCGFGRHTRALAARGLEVSGLDLSPDLLRRSGELPEAHLLLGRLVRADARRIPFRTDAFDGLVNLFSSFGYFGDEGDGEVLGEISRVLRPGGSAVLDLMNPARIRERLVPQSTTRRGAAVLHEQRALEDGGRRVTKEVTLELDGQAPRRWREDVRLYENDELVELAARFGLSCAGTWGGFDGEAFGVEAERQLVLLVCADAGPKAP